MSETPEEQRKRLERKRIETTEDDLIKCLECNLRFVRVGSHVVQVHGYSSVAEYREAHGLMARETRTPKYAAKMSSLASTKDNLQKGADTRFTTGGDHGKRIKDFWNNRRKKRT